MRLENDWKRGPDLAVVQTVRLQSQCFREGEALISTQDSLSAWSYLLPPTPPPVHRRSLSELPRELPLALSLQPWANAELS